MCCIQPQGITLGGQDCILKKNQEELFVKGTQPAAMKRMFSYPSSVAGLKGVGGKVGYNDPPPKERFTLNLI